MNQITKIFNSTTEADLKGNVVFTAITWDDLLPAIKKVIFIRDGEEIEGFIVSDEGIRIKLGRKRGRKTVIVSKPKKQKVVETVS